MHFVLGAGFSSNGFYFSVSLQVAAVSNGVHVQEKLAKVNRLDEAERHCSLGIFLSYILSVQSSVVLDF